MENIGSLPASSHQGSIRFSAAHGLSCVANAVCAIAFSLTVPTRDYFSKSEMDDSILPAGYALYLRSIPKPRLIEVHELLPNFSIQQHNFRLKSEEIVLQGSYPTSRDLYEQKCSEFAERLLPFLDEQTNSQGFLFIGLEFCVAFWKGNNQDYYVFDSHAVGPYGLPLEVENEATGEINVARLFYLPCIDDLTKFLLLRGKDGKINKYFSISKIDIEVSTNEDRDIDLHLGSSENQLIVSSTAPIDVAERFSPSQNSSDSIPLAVRFGKENVVLTSSSDSDVPLAVRFGKENVVFNLTSSSNSDVPLAVRFGKEKVVEIIPSEADSSQNSDVPLAVLFNVAQKSKNSTDCGSNKKKRREKINATAAAKKRKERDSRYYQKNKESIKIRRKEYSKRFPRIHQTAAEKYAKAHPDVSQAAVDRYRKRRPEVHRAAVETYSKNHPAVHQAAVANYDRTHPEVRRAVTSTFIKNHPNVLDRRTVKSWKIIDDSSFDELPANVIFGMFRDGNLSKIKEYVLENPNLDGTAYVCPKCLSKLFTEEKDRKEWCCQDGAIDLKIPEVSAAFYSDPKFIENARAFNNFFSFSALGTSHKYKNPPDKLGFLKIQGRTFHRVFDLAYKTTYNPLHLYISGPNERYTAAGNRNLDQQLSEDILTYLNNINPFIPIFKQLSSLDSVNAHVIFQNTTRKAQGNILGDKPDGREISFLYSTEREPYQRMNIAVWKIGSAKPHTIDIMHELYEPLQFPMLYPHGTPGWRFGLKNLKGKKLSQLKYYRYLLLKIDRFSSLNHLNDEWLCDMYCRTEEERLRYYERQQKISADNSRVARVHEIDETVGNDVACVAGKIYLPNTFTGGPRYMRTKYMDAMAIVNRLGKPSFFITITCNRDWPELQGGRHKSAAIVARVFHLKTSQLIREIKKGVWFGPVEYMFYCIEFQKRGMPHMHLALKVKNPPTQPAEIDKFLRADIPSSDEAGGLLTKLVLKFMIHGPCGKGFKTGLPCIETLKNGDTRCTKFFPKPATTTTYIDQKGFVHLRRDEQNAAFITYRRRKIMVSDCNVVPYNAALLLRYNCHLNVEVVARRNLAHYLYRYITKGADFARVQLVTENEPSEIEEYVTKRYLSGPECCWRLFSFNMVYREPSVMQLPVHLEGQHSVIFKPKKAKTAIEKSSPLLILYFTRPADTIFDNITYVEFFEKYRISTTSPSLSSLATVYRHPDNKHFIIKRQRGSKVARMYWVPPTRGELFYLRLLLGVIPARSYQDLLKPGSDVCTTFQEAARSIGLANDDNEYELALQEASTFLVGRALRRFFILLITNGADGNVLWNKHRDLICRDIIERLGNNLEKAYNSALIEIKRSLTRLGFSMLDVGLPDVVDDSTELGRELLSYNVTVLNAYVQEWLPKLSNDQYVVYKYVTELLAGQLKNVPKSIFIDGPAGTGKTLLLNVIAAFVRSCRNVAICTATSGIAAQNYEGGMTAHSMFKLPIILPGSADYWGVSNGTQRAELLRAAKIVIFDEAPMMHKNYIAVLERSFRDLMQSSVLFGDKILIFAGDFRQIPPVVKGSRGRSEIVAASFRSSEIWKKMKVFKLTESQRNSSDPQYSEFLLKLGSDKLDKFSIGVAPKTILLIPVPNIEFCTNLADLIDFAFPTNIIQNPDLCYKRAILSVLNVNINEVNRKILELLPGENRILYSSDSMNDSDAQAYLMGCDVLNHVKAAGVPDHELHLKIGALCMITRNLSFDEGLLNGTKVIIVQTSTRIVTVRKPGETENHYIPRILFKVDLDDRSLVTFNRRQFPLQLAYALTVNKSQGQTLDTIGLDLRSDVFTHGQAYVAFGRVRTSRDIKLLVNLDRVMNGTPHVSNIVYSDLIDKD